MSVIRANSSSHKSIPFPAEAELLEYSANFSSSEFAKISCGVIPGSIDDKWFIYCENMTAYFHRRSTGHCIYKVEFSKKWGGYRVLSALVNTNSAQYSQLDRAYDTRMLHFIIRNVVLGDRLPFPSAPSRPRPTSQAVTTASSKPQSISPSPSWWKIWV